MKGFIEVTVSGKEQLLNIDHIILVERGSAFTCPKPYNEIKDEIEKAMK